MAYDPSKPLTPYNTPITPYMRQTISNKLKTMASKDRDKDPAGARDYLTRIGYNFSLQRPTPPRKALRGSMNSKSGQAYQAALRQYMEQRRIMSENMAKNIVIEREKARAARIKAKQQWWADRQASQ